MKMATAAVVFKILFLVLIAHTFHTPVSPANQEAGDSSRRQQPGAGELESAVLVDESGQPAPDNEPVQTERQPEKPAARPPPAAVNHAELCYLSSGGSSLTLTVNEATQVGAIIGTVEVNGDPALEGGNVDLFVVTDARSAANATSGHPEPADNQSAKLRRVLSRRSAQIEASAELAGPTEPAPPSRKSPGGQPPPLSTGQMLGLVSDFQAGAGHSASYYSLLASTASPAHAQGPPPGPALRLEAGSRDLILVRPLDKESPEGEAGLVVSVRCRPRLGDSADSTTIPVRITVTDANDHAPEFVAGPRGLPYVVNVSETAALGSVVARDVLALDRDSAGPFSTLHYRVLEDGSAHSALLQFASPLDPTLLVAAPLDYETLSSFTLTIVAQDQGEPEPLSSSAQVQVNIIDFDDQNPKFLDDKYTLVMDESQQNLVGQNLQVLPRNLYAEDGDRAINAPIVYSFDQLGAEAAEPAGASTAASNSLADEQSLNVDHFLHLNPNTGELRLLRQWPGKWAGAPLTLVVRATQADNKDRYALTTLTITRAASAATGSRAGAQTEVPKSPDDSLVAAGTEASTRATSERLGIQFASERLSVEVLESVSVNEKIAKVRARYLSGEPADSQVVDLVQDWQLKVQNKTRRNRPAPAPEQAAGKRPINYQILDDQTDHFGINGLGEIFVKRALDYELRQEYKFRVLATYTKYSDICQVQVNVLNVNDNRPKFTQPQYTFQLTESRLRSKVIGVVAAHDADLNDTVRYSLAGDQAHLFDINQSGQISLRAGVKQLDVASCQLTVQASDSLGAPQHQHQARVNLHVAPQLVGRSINLDHLADPEGAKSSSRGRPGPKDPTSNQRSSVATVMSSLQHMVRSVNFLEMPMSSALLLSALLAFLICLLFIVIVSMSVHLYRRRSKTRHRHHLATAHLRHAHMAGALHSPAGDRQRYLRGPASDSSHSSPTNSTAAGGSPSNSSPAQQPLSSPLSGVQHDARLLPLKAGPPRTRPASAQAQGLEPAPRPHKPLQTISSQLAARLSSLDSPKGAPSGADLSLLSSLSSHSKRSYRSNTTDDSSVMHCGHYSVNSARSPCQQLQPHRPPDAEPERPGKLAQSQRSAVEAAIKSLVRDSGQMRLEDEQTAADDEATLGRQAAADAKLLKSVAHVELRLSQQPNEMAELAYSKPGIKSYRKLPLLGSLARGGPDGSAPADESAGKRQGGGNAQDSAIASDASSSGGSASQQQRLQQTKSPESSGLMAMIRDPERRPDADHFRSQRDGEKRRDSPAARPSGDIRWPPDSLPQRVKRLTWDDELSISNEECFVAPDIRLGSALSPLSNHLYLVEGTTENEDHYAEQHFLFSNPCSPALISADYATFAARNADAPQDEPLSSFMGNQNNCFDYTIVQSSQFQVDQTSFGADATSHQQSLSAQHHLLQLQLQLQQKQQQLNQQNQTAKRPGINNYLYSNSFINNQPVASAAPAATTNQDLKLMTTAVL